MGGFERQDWGRLMAQTLINRSSGHVHGNEGYQAYFVEVSIVCRDDVVGGAKYMILFKV
jgi:hypothetical protein